MDFEKGVTATLPELSEWTLHRQGAVIREGELLHGKVSTQEGGTQP